MVFIRPTILRSKEDARRLTQQRYGYVRDMQKQRNPDVEPRIDELVRDYMGAVPPVAAVPLATDSVAAPPTPSPVIGPEKPQPSHVVRPVHKIGRAPCGERGVKYCEL